MGRAADIEALLITALDKFDEPHNPVSATARRALRIAYLRRDYVAQLWLNWELAGLEGSNVGDPSDPSAKVLDQMKSLLGDDEAASKSGEAIARFQRSRRAKNTQGEDMIFPRALGQLEAELKLQREVYDDQTVPGNLTQIDTYFVSQQMDRNRAKILPTIHQQAKALEQIKTELHTFLASVETELAEGRIDAPLFVRAQEYVNAALAKYAPEALEMFVAAQDRLYSGGSEDLSQALTSCRRMVKALADSLYPATNEKISGADGVVRKMSDDLYRNRILQYVREHFEGKSTQAAVIQATLDDLGNRLKALDALASKGVHGHVSGAEAEMCVVATYLLSADILRLAGDSLTNENGG